MSKANTPTSKDTPKGLDEILSKYATPYYASGAGELSHEQAKQAITEYIKEIIGEDEELEPEAEWYAKAKEHGGTHEEYWRLKSIINNYNNLRAEQRKRLEM